LSQLWVVGGYGAPGAHQADMQTIELGWARTPYMGPPDNDSRIFIYASTDNYGGTCHDSECENSGKIHFRRTDPNFVYRAQVPVAPVGYFPNHGIFATLADSRYGVWWIYIMNSWVGYLFFDTGPLGVNAVGSNGAPADFIEVGGEIFDSPPRDIHTTTQMGMGLSAYTYGSDYFNQANNAFAACVYRGVRYLGWEPAAISTDIYSPFTWSGITKYWCYNSQVINMNPPYVIFGGAGNHWLANTHYCRTYGGGF
jgi:hypothetical protein